jgi:hypothetical protein
VDEGIICAHGQIACNLLLSLRNKDLHYFKAQSYPISVATHFYLDEKRNIKKIA